MQLVDEPIGAMLRKYSVIALALIAAINGSYAASPEFQSLLGEHGLAIANGAVAVLGFVGRFIKQASVVIGEPGGRE